MVPEAKVGVSVPELMVRLLRVESPDINAALLTVTVYVLVVVSWAVTNTVIVLAPTTRLIAPDGEALATAMVLTVTVA